MVQILFTVFGMGYIYENAQIIDNHGTLLRTTVQLALFAFDCLRSTNLPSLFDDYVTSREGVHSNRSSVYDLFIPRVNLDSVLSSIKIASSYMWNTLPHDIKSVNYSKNVF